MDTHLGPGNHQSFLSSSVTTHRSAWTTTPKCRGLFACTLGCGNIVPSALATQMQHYWWSGQPLPCDCITSFPRFWTFFLGNRGQWEDEIKTNCSAVRHSGSSADSQKLSQECKSCSQISVLCWCLSTQHMRYCRSHWILVKATFKKRGAAWQRIWTQGVQPFWTLAFSSCYLEGLL